MASSRHCTFQLQPEHGLTGQHSQPQPSHPGRPLEQADWSKPGARAGRGCRPKTTASAAATATATRLLGGGVDGLLDLLQRGVQHHRGHAQLQVDAKHRAVEEERAAHGGGAQPVLELPEAGPDGRQQRLRGRQGTAAELAASRSHATGPRGNMPPRARHSLSAGHPALLNIVVPGLLAAPLAPAHPPGTSRPAQHHCPRYPCWPPCPAPPTWYMEREQ